MFNWTLLLGDWSNVYRYDPHLDAVKEQLSREVDMYQSPIFKCFVEPNVKEDITNEFLDLLKISDFELEGYESYPRIAAEMLAYNK